jgi:fluoride exporter
VTWLAVAVGGALGSLGRHAVNVIAHTLWPRFPAGTVIVNVVGCVVIGLLAGLLASERIAMRPHWREFVFVGLLGGFTTFSTFGLDTYVLLRSEGAGSAALNILVQVIGGLLAVWVGYQLGVAKP